MGDPADKVDFLILGEGYTAAEMDKFVAGRPAHDRRPAFDRTVQGRPQEFQRLGALPAVRGKRRDAPLHRRLPRLTVGTAYDTFGFERYMLASDNKALRKITQFAPYEFTEILANNRTYGGGGIFNLYSTVAVDNAFANYIFVHERHHFAG
ncbi:M64 family metallopeptidase [Paucibacter sp. O1-1]|nr:M64 family metallopeptidase [Paucibacter sp. O1-1]MDA3830005.1 M64 family metallopeptidase [Paucibacter sp. O1-1]